ncbi:amidase [Breoghania sp. L-A4]|uniref:amidase n=1 Tax=Breoghania sp. L-A4 TaxID=2304600 RepID=UPI000E35A4ED|nr:amidase [Breoghania sp. L-A4]AXS41527.1 amidase [Breoghania sp. L-A4]
MSEPWKKTVAELGDALSSGRISSVDLVSMFLERIERLNPRINALVTADDTALAQARASDARRAAGSPLGPLDGIPFAVKDNILTKDLRTTWGSRVYEDFLPGEDETPVERLKAAGMIVLGKTNVPEFTLEGFTDNPLFGPTRNPWNLGVTPGGSSGGSVAGVASGLFPAALGTDGGGSIRRPCGYTGLFGLKPTIGRVARTHTLPQVLIDMEVVGPITRDVTSAAMLLAAIEGAHPGDPRSWLPAEPGRETPLETAPSALRILYVERFAEAPLDPVIAESTRAFATRLEALGHTVTPGGMPFDIGPLNAAWTSIGPAGLGALLDTPEITFDKASPKYRAMAQGSRAIGSDRLFAIVDLIARLREAAARAFRSVDVILTPSSAAMPWAIGTDFPPEIDGQPVGPRGHAIYTAWVNAIGHPAVNLPAAPAPDGMPVGVQLVGGHNRDWLLLRLARQIEAASPWARNWPAMASD